MNATIIRSARTTRILGAVAPCTTGFAYTTRSGLRSGVSDTREAAIRRVTFGQAPSGDLARWVTLHNHTTGA